MTSVLVIEQLEQELTDLREQNRQLIRERRNVQNENFHLRRHLHQDREWLADALRIIHEARNQPVGTTVVSCSCGVEAILQHAHKRAVDAEKIFDINNDE